MTSKANTTATKEEAKPALVPKLRFPEFRGEPAWPVHKLADLCALNKGEQLAAADKDAGGRFPHYNGGIFPSSHTARANRKANTIIISEGGNSCGYVQFVTEQFWSGGHNYSLAVKEKVDTLCLFYALQAKQREIMALRIGSGLPNIQKFTLGQFDVFLPQRSAEQQKIAECLSSVDEVIAAQARKLDALQTHKKGLMQQLFPREGETQPRLRFPEFQTGEWEVKPLGELVELQSGFAFSSSSFGSEGRKLVTPKNFTKHGHGNFDESVSKYTTENVPERFVCKPGDLLVLLTDLTPTCELLGKPLLLEEKDENVLLNQRVVRVEPSASELETLFLKYVFLSETYSQRIIKTATGSMPLFHPALPEQHRIASCLSSLDALIAAETQKHAALQRHKRGLMQQLFPSPEEPS